MVADDIPSSNILSDSVEQGERRREMQSWPLQLQRMGGGKPSRTLYCMILYIMYEIQFFHYFLKSRNCKLHRFVHKASLKKRVQCQVK